MEIDQQDAGQPIPEDDAFMREVGLLRKVLESRQRWCWLPWVGEILSTQEKISFEHGPVLLKKRRCWQVWGVNLYLAEKGGIMHRDNGILVGDDIEYFRSRGLTVPYTNAMREMRRRLTGK